MAMLLFLTLMDDGSRILGFLSSVTNSTTATFKVNYGGAHTDILAASDTANGNSHSIKLNIYYKVSSISGTTITLTDNLSTTFSDKKIVFQTYSAASSPTSKKYRVKISI